MRDISLPANTKVAAILRVLSLMAGISVASSAAHAIENGNADRTTPSTSLRGFGTLGLTHSSLHEADYVASRQQASGAGFTHKWAAGVDSKIGLQLDAQLSEKLSGVLQVVSQQRTDKSYAAQVEWANLKYQFRPEFSVRAGRILLPVNMASEARMIGYANPWIRPPIEVYSLAEITHSDGVDAAYRLHTANAAHTMQVFFGQRDQDLVSSLGGKTSAITVRVRQLAGLAYTLETGPWSVRAALLTAKVYPVNEEGRVHFYNLGAIYDVQRWFIQGEWSTLNSSLMTRGEETPRRNALYVTAGFRRGHLTPYMTYSRMDVAGSLRLSPAGPGEQETISAGLRWDITSSAALKLQFDYVKPGDEGTGYFVNVQSGLPNGASARVFGLAMDFIF